MIGFPVRLSILCMPLCEKRANSYAFVSEPRRIKPARVLARGVFDSKSHRGDIGTITNLVQSGSPGVRLRRIAALRRIILPTDPGAATPVASAGVYSLAFVRIGRGKSADIKLHEKS
jgi:hypothetical protein